MSEKEMLRQIDFSYFLSIGQTIQFVMREREGEKRFLNFFIPKLYAQGLILGLFRKKTPRPLTHDLFLDMMAKLGFELSSVVFANSKDDGYQCITYFRAGDREFCLESNPTDCLTLATKARAPIFIEEELLEREGLKEDPIKAYSETGQAGEEGRHLDS